MVIKTKKEPIVIATDSTKCNSQINYYFSISQNSNLHNRGKNNGRT